MSLELRSTRGSTKTSKYNSVVQNKERIIWNHEGRDISRRVALSAQLPTTGRVRVLVYFGPNVPSGICA